MASTHAGSTQPYIPEDTPETIVEEVVEVEKIVEDYQIEVKNEPQKVVKKKVVPTYSKPQKKALETKFGSEHPLLAVADCESGMRQYNNDGTLLVNPAPNSSASGIFQILTITHGPEARRLGLDLTTPEGNMEFAEHLYERNGLRDWNESKSCWKHKV